MINTKFDAKNAKSEFDLGSQTGLYPLTPLPHVFGVKNDNKFLRSQNVYIYGR